MKLLAKAFVLLLLSFPMFLGSCGPLVEVRETPSGGGGGGGGGDVKPPPPPNQNIGFDEAVDIMDDYCGACHASSPWMQSESSLKRSSVAVRVSNKTMPPGLSDLKMPEAERAKLMTYF